MSKEYIVQTFQPWETDEGLVRDAHGNYKGTVWFEQSEKQVDATFKTIPEAGDKKYGDIVEYTTKAGKTRLKFQRADRPQDHSAPHSNKKEWTPRDDEAIKAQWALGRAYERNGKSEKTVEEAQWLFSQIEVIKGSEIKVASQETKEVDEFATALTKGLEADGVDLSEIPF